MKSLYTCLRVIRPHIVAGGFLGYSLGVLLALRRGRALDPAVFALGYAVVLFGDLSTHISNDYFDIRINCTHTSDAVAYCPLLIESGDDNGKLDRSAPHSRHLVCPNPF